MQVKLKAWKVFELKSWKEMITWNWSCWFIACVVLHNLLIQNFYDIEWNDAHGIDFDEDNVEHTMFKRLSMARENRVK